MTTATFGPAVSPHLAAELAGAMLDLDALVARARGRRRTAPTCSSPRASAACSCRSATSRVRDLAVALGLPLVVAARPGLGTINHSLLTIEAARAAGLDVRAVVLTPWPDEPSVMQQSNRATIARLGEVEVAALPATTPAVEDLARAGATLPFDRWLGGG